MQNPSPIGQIECYCNSSTDQHAYQCLICKKYYHRRCYSFINQPDRIVCIMCKLANHDPYHTIKEFLHHKPFYIMNAGDSFNPISLKFDIRSLNTLSQLIQGHLKMAIICTKNVPTTKHDKKQSYPPIYQWISNNLYLEWNDGQHIQYHEYEYAFIQPSWIKQYNTLTIKSQVLEESGVLAVAILQENSLDSVWQYVISNQDKINNLQANEESYLEKLKLLQRQTNTDEIELDTCGIAINFIDPTTLKRIDYTARGLECQHLECFDLYNFLTVNKISSAVRWRCPLCGKFVYKSDIIIDLVQMKLLQEIKLKYQKLNIDRIYLMNDKFEYKIQKDLPSFLASNESEYISVYRKVWKQDKFKIYLTKLEKSYPQIRQLISETDESVLLTRQECKLLFQELKDVLIQFKNEGQLCHLFINLFGNDYLQTSIFGQNLSKKWSLQDISQQLYENSFSGLIVDFMLYARKNMHQVSDMIAVFCYDQVYYQFKIDKVIEISLAISYGIKNQYKKHFEHHAKESIGYIIGYILEYMFRSMQNSKNIVMQFLQENLQDLYLPLLDGNMKNNFKCVGEFLANFYLNFRISEFEKVLKELYVVETKNKVNVIRFGLLVYGIVVQRSVQQQEEWKNVLNGINPAIVEILDKIEISIEKVFS